MFAAELAAVLEAAFHSAGGIARIEPATGILAACSGLDQEPGRTVDVEPIDAFARHAERPLRLVMRRRAVQIPILRRPVIRTAVENCTLGTSAGASGMSRAVETLAQRLPESL